MTRIVRTNVNVPIIIQTIGGDLRVRGRGEGELIVDGDGLRVEQIGDGQPYLVRCDGDSRMSVPSNVDVIVQQVGGDAKLTDLGGTTDINAISGDLTLRNTKAVQVKTVGGDLRLKWADGPVAVRVIGSDATIREVNGDLSVEIVGADLFVRNVQGNCVIDKVGSDLVISMDFLPEREYRFHAGSDILCRIQPDTNARFIVPAETALALDIPAEITEDGEQQIVTLGDGRATIYIEAGEELRLVSEEEDYVFDLGVQIEEELDARLSSLEERLSQQLEGLDERIQAKTEQYVSQAEQFAARAQHQAERAAERFRRSMDRQKPKRKREPGPRFEFNWGRPPAPPVPPEPPRRRSSEPVTEQERLMILQMVQDKKISIEEAERLLAALDSQD